MKIQKLKISVKFALTFIFLNKNLKILFSIASSSNVSVYFTPKSSSTSIPSDVLFNFYTINCVFANFLLVLLFPLRSVNIII